MEVLKSFGDAKLSDIKDILRISPVLLSPATTILRAAKCRKSLQTRAAATVFVSPKRRQA